MAVLNGVWVPTVVVAHLLGLVLLLYSLEKVCGIVSKVYKSLFGHEVVPAPEDGMAKALSIGRTLSLTATAGIHQTATFPTETLKSHVKEEKTWIRGCDCQVGRSICVIVRTHGCPVGSFQDATMEPELLRLTTPA